MSNPYSDLPESAFWKPAVGERRPRQIAGLWSPRFEITPDTPVATYGSCFAQHFSRQLVARGFSWLNAEPAPEGTDDDEATRLNYGVFTARTGNIYTAAALLQWLRWAAGRESPPDEVWETDGRFFDPFRPAIRPGGFADAAAVRADRARTVEAFGRSVREAGLFVFTMGLTEAWVNRQSGHVYAVCPGTVAGRFDEDRHGFVNFRFGQIFEQMTEALALLRALNPDIRVLLTVSPVPLTATASGEHVLTATTWSKSVLRAVAGELAETEPGVDYFPSYEIITAPPFGGRFFEPNMRSVSRRGVNFVMESFFRAIGHEAAVNQRAAAGPRKPGKRSAAPPAGQALVCEEEMLDAHAASTAAPAQPAEGRRVGLLGNSHLATLRRSFAARDAPVDGVIFDFWGLPGDFQQIKVLDHGVTHDDRQRSVRVNGPGRESFDFRGLQALVMMAEPVALPSLMIDIAKARPDLDDPASDAYAQELLRRIEMRVGMTALRTACRVIDGPVIALQQPMYREGARRARRLPPLTGAAFDRINGRIRDHMSGMGVVYLPQPVETLTPDCRSIDRFSKAAADGKASKPREDFAHMNNDYGALVLDRVAALLSLPRAQQSGPRLGVVHL